MKHWFRRIRGAFLMGVTWALAWGLGIGGFIELLLNLGLGQDWMHRIDMWPQTLAIPGFISGAVFSVVLGIAGRGRKFEDLSMPRFAAWGVAGGLLGGSILIGLWGISGPLGVTVFLGMPALLSAISATGTLALARLTERRELIGAKEAEVTFSGKGAEKLSEGRE